MHVRSVAEERHKFERARVFPSGMFLQDCIFGSNDTMPKYYGAGIDARLSVCSLGASTDTAFVRREHHGPELERLDSILRGSTTLTESTIPLQGDIGRVHYIGPNEEFPLVLVRAGKPCDREYPNKTNEPESHPRSHIIATEKKMMPASSSQKHAGVLAPSISERAVIGAASGATKPSKNIISLKPSTWTPKHGNRCQDAKPQFAKPWPVTGRIQDATKRLSRTSAAKITKVAQPDPKALCLTVELAPQCFNRDAVPGRDDDAKVEVFVNGQFSGYRFIPSRQSSHKATITAQFSGYKCDRVLEYPFIVHPSSDANYINGREDLQPDLARQTWNTINKQLAQQAYSAGRNILGERPPSANYLLSLAEIDIPDSLANEALPKGMTFGIVDVIVTLGKGKKAEVSAGYLKKPQASIDRDFRTFPFCSETPSKLSPSEGSESSLVKTTSSFTPDNQSMISQADMKYVIKDDSPNAAATAKCLKTTFSGSGQEYARIPVPSQTWQYTVSPPQIDRSGCGTASPSVDFEDELALKDNEIGHYSEWQSSPGK